MHTTVPHHMELEDAAQIAPHVLELIRKDVIDIARQAVCAQLPLSTDQVAPPDGGPIGDLQIYRGYDPVDLKLFDEFINPTRKAEPGFIVDFLGGRTRVSSLYDQVQDMGGHVHGVPVPGDYHAEATEWLGLIKTVMTARERYVAMEWGAGWGPWLIAGGVAARNRGIMDIKLYGVEADPVHFETLRQHYIDNGFAPDEHFLAMAAVGAQEGSALWPCHPDPRNDWGTRPVRAGDASDEDYNGGRINEFKEVDILAGRDLLARELLWDMLHIDIQGWEADVCAAARQILDERVRWVIIGTHSRPVEAELLIGFQASGWILEHEKPCRFNYTTAKKDFVSMISADGVQVWRNPRLT